MCCLNYRRDLNSAIACAIKRGNAIAALSGHRVCALSACYNKYTRSRLIGST